MFATERAVASLAVIFKSWQIHPSHGPDVGLGSCVYLWSAKSARFPFLITSAFWPLSDVLSFVRTHRTAYPSLRPPCLPAFLHPAVLHPRLSHSADIFSAHDLTVVFLHHVFPPHPPYSPSSCCCHPRSHIMILVPCECP